jgi:hypothetical protein
MVTAVSAKRGLLLLALLMGPVAGGSCARNYRLCPAPDSARMDQLPPRLSATGLYRDLARGAIAPDARAYVPAYPLWSDGASKQRWIHLPPGARIDTSDMDAWQFPQGTKFWKEFTSAGVRVETRLFAKVGPAPGDWAAAAYVWNADQSDAILRPEGASDVLGTSHDVPSASQCLACHGGVQSRILGFSAVQLAAAPPGQLTLDDLVAANLLTVPPARRPTIPGSADQRAALGYLHANCGHCHNRTRPVSVGPRCYDPRSRLDLFLRVNQLDDVADTAPYRTAINFFVRPGRPAESPLLIRMSHRHPDGWGMPPLASEQVDGPAVELLGRWIETLAAP